MTSLWAVGRLSQPLVWRTARTPFTYLHGGSDAFQSKLSQAEEKLQYSFAALQFFFTLKSLTEMWWCEEATFFQCVVSQASVLTWTDIQHSASGFSTSLCFTAMSPLWINFNIPVNFVTVKLCMCLPGCAFPLRGAWECPCGLERQICLNPGENI